MYLLKYVRFNGLFSVRCGIFPPNPFHRSREHANGRISSEAATTTVQVSAYPRFKVVDPAYKEDIGYSIDPVIDYVDGSDSIYLCSPLETTEGHPCLWIQSWTQTRWIDHGLVMDWFDVVFQAILPACLLVCLLWLVSRASQSAP